MAFKLNVGAFLFAMSLAVLVGVGMGLGVGLLTRYLGWSTRWVGPLTGALVGAMVPFLYRWRTTAGSRGADEP